MFPLIFVGIAGVSVVGCNELSGLAGKQALPAGTSDPSTYDTPEGALALYQGVVYSFQQAGSDTASSEGKISNNAGTFADFVLTSGLLTDELHAGNWGGNQLNYTTLAHGDEVDARQTPEGEVFSTDDIENVYAEIQGIRNSATLAIGALATYDSAASPALRGHLYALQGYSILMLADLYCSGVPLSTLNYKADYTYRSGLTTTQLYRTAVAKFDTALSLSTDSTRILNFARIGKGRAFLDLGQYDSAAAAVENVPDGYVYQFPLNWKPRAITGGLFANSAGNVGVTVSDSEGEVGLPYLSSGDPRSASSTWGNNNYLAPQYAPNAYGGASPGVAQITVASWIEARLMQAEAALQQGSFAQWLVILNQLRTDGTQSLIPPDTVVDTLGVTGCSASAKCGTSPGGNAASNGQPAGYPPAGYTLATTMTTYPAPVGIQSKCASNSWYIPCSQGDSMIVRRYVRPAYLQYNAGDGGVAGLAPLADPGTLAGRVTLLFQERAYWLFLTGHRQGDLRRLIRNYNVEPDAAYPTGVYPLFGQLSSYGEDVTLPIPSAEHANPLFTGCFSRGA